MRSICHIPAKLASKRLVMKNLQIVHDRPAFYWPVMAALQSEMFDEVVLTSDIPEMFYRFKGQCPELFEVTMAKQRPSTLVGTTHDAVREFGSYEGRVTIILATAVLLQPDDIREGIALSEERDAPVQAVIVHRGDLMEQRRGKLRWLRLPEERWEDAGSLYTWPPGQFRGVKDIDGMTGYVVPRFRTVDMDIEDDLQLARILFENQNRVGPEGSMLTGAEGGRV